MTAVDALRTLFKALALDREDAGLIADYGMIGLHAIRAARAALAEKGESELVKLLREAGEQIERSALNIRGASGHRAAKYHFGLHDRITAALAKHALPDPPKE